tara:strand:- start:1268 stop:1534 length:267 start_codon:yes stop_codon:yes gene_type:complete
MIKSQKKTKKKIFLNGAPKKIDYDAYMLIRNQEKQLQNNIEALFKYVLIHNNKKKHTEDEKILYDYCMQFPTILQALENLKKENESER